MRMAFLRTICELAEVDERLWLLTGDLGYSVLERFANSFPDRFINAGVAEQNMSGVAAGLALSGKVVFTYSIANFPILRCLEQVRNDICYHSLNVKIVSVGGGVAYGSAGYSHHATEDLAIMRVLPNITVFAPGDPVEVSLVTQGAAAIPGPCYIRLGKGGDPVIHQAVPDFVIGKPIEIREGSDVSIFSTGGILHDAVMAAEALNERGCSASIVSMPTLEPLDRASVLSFCRRTKFVFTVEEHGPGGLADIVADVIARSGTSVQFHPLTLKPKTDTMAGDQKYLRGASGLEAKDIVGRVMRVFDPAKNKGNNSSQYE